MAPPMRPSPSGMMLSCSSTVVRPYIQMAPSPLGLGSNWIVPLTGFVAQDVRPKAVVHV